MSNKRIASISQKIIMSLAGLFLFSFLTVHLSVNLLSIFGKELFNDAAYFMGENPIIQSMQLVLFAGFFLHMLLGVAVWIQNRKARPVKYYKASDTETSFLSKYMIHTGIIIGIFLVLHFMNFFFVKIGLIPAPNGINVHKNMYALMELVFSNTLYSVTYIVSLIIMGFHLNHAFQSAFQTLGLNHSKYTLYIKGFGTLYSILLTIGFLIIPIYFMI